MEVESSGMPDSGVEWWTVWRRWEGRLFIKTDAKW